MAGRTGEEYFPFPFAFLFPRLLLVGDRAPFASLDSDIFFLRSLRLFVRRFSRGQWRKGDDLV